MRLGVAVPEPADSWADAGFATAGSGTTIGATAIRFDHDGAPGFVFGIDHARSADAAPSTLDGIPVAVVDSDDLGRDEEVAHPNGIVSVDHVVVGAPDLDRYTEAMAGIGSDLRRTRELGNGRQQRFFRLAGTIIEVIGDVSSPGPDPASIWGLALVSEDIDATAASLPGACTPPKDAVQPGRRIATIDNRSFGIGLRLAVMTPHVRT